MRRRRGYSLIECLVMITLIAITLGTVTMTLHAMNRAERRLRADVEHSETISRLASQLRSDTHMAASAMLAVAANNDSMLQLSFADGKTIEYQLSERGVNRTVRSQDSIQHHDTFALRMGKESRWEVDTNRHRPLVSLSVPLFSAKEPNGLVPAQFRLQAAVNLGDSRQQKGE